MPDPVIEPVVEPVVDPVVVEPVVDVLEPTVEVEAAPEPKAPLPKWMLDRIAEAQRNEATARQATEVEKRRATEAEALAARLQKGDTTVMPPLRQPDAIDAALIDQAANQKLMTQARQQIIKDGYAAFTGPKFDEMANILGAVGCVNDEFIADVLAVDRPNAHKTLAALAAEPETAARLASLDSRSRIAELTRITMAKAAVAAVIDPPAPKPAPKVVSKAPAPPPVVEPSASKVIDWRADETSDEDFTKGFEETMKKRSGRR
jgi:hypothetical protein